MARAKTLEEIRAERIANLKDPEAIAAIKKIEEERKERLAEVRQSQRDNYEKLVEDMVRLKEASRAGPQYTPSDKKPDPPLGHGGQALVEHEARAEILPRFKMQDRAENMAFDKRVDRELDAADRRQGREPGHTLEHDGPDRFDR